jgi:hypothetical protein
MTLTGQNRKTAREPKTVTVLKSQLLALLVLWAVVLVASFVGMMSLAQDLSSAKMEITKVQAIAKTSGEQARACAEQSSLYKQSAIALAVSASKYLDSFPYGKLDLSSANDLTDRAEAINCEGSK